MIIPTIDNSPVRAVHVGVDRTERAWAAGFWDGEGWTNLVRFGRGDATRPMARINQSGVSGVPEVLTRFRAAAGCGTLSGPELMHGREPLYKWVASSRGDIEKVFQAIRPWLGPVKIRQFELVLGRTTLASTVSITDEEDLAWAAGFFDGEGSTYLEKHRTHPGYFNLEMSVTQSDARGRPHVQEKFARLAGIGRIYGPYPSGPAWDPVYRWKVRKPALIQELVSRLDPWLGDLKRVQAAEALSVVNAQTLLPRGNPAWGNRKTRCVSPRP